MGHLIPCQIGSLTLKTSQSKSCSFVQLNLPKSKHNCLHNSMISCEMYQNEIYIFLAHLSRRLIGKLIVYPWSGVRRRRASSTMLKHLLLRNRSADQSQILCGASLGRGNKILLAACWSHDQDGCHAHIW